MIKLLRDGAWITLEEEILACFKRRRIIVVNYTVRPLRHGFIYIIETEKGVRG